MATDIHPHGDEALAEMEREQEASRKRNRELEAEENARRVQSVVDAAADLDQVTKAEAKKAK